MTYLSMSICGDISPKPEGDFGYRSVRPPQKATELEGGRATPGFCLTGHTIFEYIPWFRPIGLGHLSVPGSDQKGPFSFSIQE